MTPKEGRKLSIGGIWKVILEIAEDKPILKFFMAIFKYIAIFGSAVWGWLVHHEHIGKFFTSLFHNK